MTILKRFHAVLVLFCLAIAPPAEAREITAKGKVLDIQSVTSESGITAWLAEDHSLPIIALHFQFRESGAAYDPQDRQGLAQLASNTFDEGAGPYDSQTFQKLLTDNSIDLSFSSSRDVFGGRVKTLTRHKDLAFRLLQLALAEPRFDQDALDRMKAANIARIRSSLTDPDWMAARIANDLAFAGHPYARNAGGTISGLKAITPEDLKNFAATHFARDRLIVSVAGDITPGELKERLDTLFGKLPRKASAPLLADGTVKNGGTVALYKKDIPQTVMTVMQPGFGHLDPDYFAGQVMNFIFGGSGFGSRLMDEIREKRGLTYGIYSGFYELEHLKGFTISASFNNENAAQVLTLMRQEMKKMQTAKVTPEELKAAKSYIIGSLPLTMSSTESICNMLSDIQYNRWPIDFLDKRAALFNAVTAGDVQRAAKRLLQPDNLTTVLVGQPVNVKPTRTIDALPNVE